MYVELFKEGVDNDNIEKAVDAIFTFAAIDNYRNPIPLKFKEIANQLV